MKDFVRELTLAARSLRRTPAFTATAILTLALGIGASTAIFSVVSAVLLRPLPYTDAERLVLIWGDMRNRDVYDFPFPPADYADLVEQGTQFEGIAALATFAQRLVYEDEAEQIQVGAATTNLFSLLGARVVLGRNFVPEDGTPLPAPPAVPNAPAGAGAQDQPPPPPAATLISHHFWEQRFGADPDVIGEIVQIGGGPPAEIVGVLGPDFEMLFPPGTGVERLPEMWQAMRIDFAGGSRINVFLRVIGKLKPGVTLAQAQAQMDRLAADLRQRFPIKETSGLHLRVEPMHEDLVTDVRPAILALMGAVTFVLLIACANVANLHLVRAWTRERELAVRSALGGARWDLIRQMLLESVVLAAGGVATGIALAYLGIEILLALAPPTIPRADAVSIDLPVLGFSILAGVVAAVAAGVLPAIRASRPDVMESLRAGGRSPALGSGGLLRNAVVTAEVALSLVLLIGCGLMLRSFIALQRTDPGYDAGGVLTFQLQQNRPTPEEREAFSRSVRDRLAALPGVSAVAATFPLPLDGGIANARWGPEEALGDASLFQQADAFFVLPGYFDAMGTRVLAGRTFEEADNTPDLTRVVIDERFAAKAFPGENPVGKEILIRIRTDEPERFEVIGVVEHQRHQSLASDGREQAFFADGLLGHGVAGRWVVRTAGDPAQLGPSVRRAVAELDHLVPVAQMQPMNAFVDRAAGPTRFALALIAAFAAIAAVLAAVGLYGVLSTAVRQRTAEIGVRMAFGAPSGSIFRLVIGQGLRLSIIGVVIGVLTAFALTRVMASMLVEVQPTDPLTFATLSLLLVVIAALASWIPARRAAALDPGVALREE